MSQVEVERLLGRLLTDADFRTMAAHSLKKAAGKEGIVLSVEEMSLLSRMNFAQFGLVAESLDGSIRRK